MNITCTICNDLVNPSESIFVTKCGHIFHHHCLAQWLERAHTCPQCRSRVSSKDMFRIYPTLAEGGVEDAATLQSRLDAANLQLREHKQIRSDLEKKAADCAADLSKTRELLKKTEERLVSAESATGVLKEQLRGLRHAERDNQQLKEENRQLKKEQDACTAVQRVISASYDEAEEIISTYPDTKSIAVFAIALKRALSETEVKWREARADLNSKTSDIVLLRAKYRRTKEKLARLSESHDELRGKRKAEDDIQDQCKKQHLEETQNPDIIENTIVADSNNLTDADKSLGGLIRDIENANSPYLKLRTGGPAHTFKPSEMTTMKSIQNSQFSIFGNKRVGSAVTTIPLRGGPIGSIPKEEAKFDGLGGHSVPEIFPRSIPRIGVKHRLKRPSPATPSKLTPITQIFSKLK